MPFNPQTKIQSNFCEQLLAKFVKYEEPSQVQNESVLSGENIEIAEGKWENDQNLKFIIFIDFHSKIFSSKQRRKTQKIFKSLSKFLGNRTPAQCRSHYQKVMMKFKTVAKLKKYFKEYFGEDLYNQHFQEFEQSCKQNHGDQIQQKDQKTTKETQQISIQTDPVLMLDDSIQQMLAYWQLQQWNMSFYSCPYNLWMGEKVCEP